MQIANAVCPECKAGFIVDEKLWNIGTVKLRCIACKHAFLPPRSPKSLSVEEAVNAAVPIRVRETR